MTMNFIFGKVRIFAVWMLAAIFLVSCCAKDEDVVIPNAELSAVTIEGNVLNVEMAPKTFVLYKFVKASNK